MARVTLPDRSNTIVVPDEELQLYLNQGYITQELYQQEAKTTAEQKYALWLASPESLEKRFEMLRQERDARISQTDYLMASDYPLTENLRQAVIAYRQSLRDIPAQAGAPWDGGGERTPWPVLGKADLHKSE